MGSAWCSALTIRLSRRVYDSMCAAVVRHGVYHTIDGGLEPSWRAASLRRLLLVPFRADCGIQEIPTGGVLSPLQWYLVVDVLVARLSERWDIY